MEIRDTSYSAMDMLNKLGWVKYFKPALKGQFYFMPRGVMVFNLVAQFLKNWVIKELDSLEIKTPILYDWNDPAIQAESSCFKDRIFQCEYYGKNNVLRPGGDYGVMSLLSDKILHEGHLPISLFELAISFRKSHTRELLGLVRGQVFNLLDHHSFNANDEQAWDNYISIISSQAKLGDFFNCDWDINIQIEKSFLKKYEYKLFYIEKILKKKINVIKLKERTNYWSMQHHFLDKRDNLTFSDGQYDLINAKNYNIRYLCKNRISKNYPIICHGSFDSVERWIYKLVYNALSSNGYEFPIWLSPIQIRFITKDPLIIKAAEEFKKNPLLYPVRVDIDSSNKGKLSKIKNSFKEWIPFTIIFPESFTSFNSSKITVYRLNGIKEDCYIKKILELIQDKEAPLSRSLIDLQSIINKPSLR